MSGENRSLRLPDYSRDFIDSGLAKTLEALEMFHQFRGRGLSYPLDSIELAYGLRLAAPVAVVGDAEAVGLVAKVLHNAQTR